MCVAVGLQRSAYGHLAGCGKLDCIVGQIDQYLAQPSRITSQHGRNVRIYGVGEVEILSVRLDRHNISSLFHRRRQVEIQRFQIQFACVDFREVEDIVYQRQQLISTSSNGLS